MRIIIIVSILVLFSSCRSEELLEKDKREVSIITDSLEGRFQKKDKSVLIMKEGGARKGGKKDNIKLSLVGELSSPRIDGEVLQATAIDRSGDFILVSYNFRGEPYAGAIDLINRNLELKAQILLGDTDISQVAGNEGEVYFVGGTSSLANNTAFVERIGIDRDNETFTWPDSRMGLGSYVATSVFVNENGVFVTTGDDASRGGGLYKLSPELDVQSYEAIQDARWVTGDKDLVFTLSGQPKEVLIWRQRDLRRHKSFNHDGEPQQGAKLTMDVEKSRYFVAGGLAGLMVYKKSGKLSQQIEFDDNSITNAVSSDEGLVFISNGEGGVYVGKEKGNKVDLLGKLDLDTKESVNHISLIGDYLYVASGIGGVKMIRIDTK